MVEELKVIKVATLDIHEGLVARVGNTASSGRMSMSTANEKSIGFGFFFSLSSFKYLASIRGCHYRRWESLPRYCLIARHPRLSVQLGDQHKKREGGLVLLIPHAHLVW